MSQFSLAELEEIIAARAAADPDASWTARLVAGGMEKACEKLGEEAIETVIAALSRDRDGTCRETADLLYHLLVVLHLKGVAIEDVMAELQQRTARSGLAEKAARNTTPS